MKDFRDESERDDSYEVSSSLFDEILIKDAENLQTTDSLSKDSFVGMHARIIQLVIGLFEKGYISKAFNIGLTHHPTITFIERLRRLLLLETMTDRLFHEILPQIIRKLAFQHYRHIEIHTDRIQGAIDPVRTQQLNPLSLSISAAYATRHHKKDFLTPENMLIGLTINTLLRDVDQLLNHRIFIQRLDIQERDILTDCILRSQRIKRHSHIARLCRAAEQVAREPALLEETERSAHKQINMNTGKGWEGYRNLVRWREAYHHLDIKGGDLPDKAPTRPIPDNQGYELLVMLELISILGQSGMVRQLQPLSVKDRRATGPVFECIFSKHEKWEIYYQTSAPLSTYRYVRHLSGIPDLLILNPYTDRLLICDAKKYTVTSYGGAFFKMLGYLYQFGYPQAFNRIAGGVLFIPENIGQEPGWTEWAGGTDDRQSITTITIPISGLVDRAAQKECRLWIEKARRSLSGGRTD